MNQGLLDYWRAHRLLFRKGLWPLFLIPGIVSLTYVPLVAVFTFLFLRDVTVAIHDRWVPDALQSDFTQIVLALSLFAVGVSGGFILYRNAIMVLYSPILAYLSEASERHAYGTVPEGPSRGITLRGACASAMRGTGLSLLTVLFALLGLLVGLVISLIPLIGGLAAAVLVPAWQFYLAGVGFCDPPLERRGYRIRHTLRHAWRFKWRTLGQGTGFSLLLLLPVVGWFLAPSYGVVAGTLGTVAILKEEEMSEDEGRAGDSDLQPTGREGDMSFGERDGHQSMAGISRE